MTDVRTRQTRGGRVGGGVVLYINLCLPPDEINKKLKYGRYEHKTDRKGI